MVPNVCTKFAHGTYRSKDALVAGRHRENEQKTGITAMKLDYDTYEQAASEFEWSDRWTIFDGTPESFNLAHECLDRWDDGRTGVRIQFDDYRREVYDIAEIRRPAAQFAHALADRGIEAGEPVAVMLEPSLELYATMFGIFKRGAVYVPMFNLFGSEAIEYRLNDSGADVLVTTETKAADDVSDDLDCEVIRTPEEFDSFIEGRPTTYEGTTAADDVSVIQYTSGTTGTPEGYRMRHKTLTQSIVTLLFAYGVRRTDSYVNPSPPAWAHGLWMGTLAPLSIGTAAGAYAGKFEPETLLAGLESFEATNLAAAATAFRQLVNSDVLTDFDLQLERISSTGEPLDTGTYRALRDTLNVSVADVYGISEFGPIIANYNGFEGWEPKIDSIGKPLPGLEVALLDDNGDEVPVGEVGEICVKRGDEWIRSGDAGTKDEDGYFYHKGRTDDVIISSGWRIDPHEVEAAVLMHPAVDECAVVASSDEMRGHIVKAFVRTAEETENTDDLRESIKQRVKNDLSKHEYPREVEFVAELPYTESGKIKRKELREHEE
jgi:acetyl-CoA synthetase